MGDVSLLDLKTNQLPGGVDAVGTGPGAYMHGSKKFIVVGDALEYARWYDRLVNARRRPTGGRRLKRSRHRTSVDTYLVRETDVTWLDLHFGGAPAPKWWRRVLNRRYRARINNLMRHERYDTLYSRPRDGSWFW